MGKSVIKTTGYHTCERRINQDEAFIIKTAPFKAITAKKNINGEIKMHFQFLGDGYYFWDDDIEMAKWWGRAHYANKYWTIACELSLEGERFLDITGTPSDQRRFAKYLQDAKDLINDWLDRFPFLKKERYSIAGHLWLLRKITELNVKNGGNDDLFPIDSIRISSLKHVETEHFKEDFKTNKDKAIVKSTNIICIYDEKLLPLQKSIVHIEVR